MMVVQGSGSGVQGSKVHSLAFKGATLTVLGFSRITTYL